MPYVQNYPRHGRKNRMIKNTILKNKTDIILSLSLAAISGLIFYYPNYKIPRKVSSNKVLSEHFIYAPITAERVSPTHDELRYAELVRESMDGNKYLGDPVIFEHRKDFNPLNMLPFVIAGFFSKLLGSVGSFFKWADFFFPAISIIAGYFFLRLFLKNRLIAFWGIIILLSMYSFFPLLNVLLFNFNSAFRHTNNFKIAINVFALKYPSYQFVFPFTFLFYYFCYKLLTKNKNIHFLITGALLGLSCYIYIYSFMTLALQITFLMIWVFIKGKKDLAFKFFLAGILALVIAFPYMVRMLIFTLNPDHIYKSMMAGMSKSVDYNIVKTLIKFLICTTLLLYISRKIRAIGNEVAFLLSFIGSVSFIMILSMIIFFLPQTQHLNTFEARNVVVISLLLPVSMLLKKDQIKALFPERLFQHFIGKQKLISFAKICLIGVIILHSTQIMASQLYYLHKKSTLYYHKYTIDHDTMDAYTWLDKHVPKESVVLTINEKTIGEIPLFTGCFVYIPDMFLTMSPIEEVWDRVKQGFGFYGVNKQKLECVLEGYKPVYSEEILNLEPKSELDIKKIQQARLEFEKKWFAELVFSANFLFDSKSLTYQHYKKYLTPDELDLIHGREKGRLFWQGIFFIPTNLINEQLSNYKTEEGNIDLLKYKVDYIWFGPLEKDLAGTERIRSDKLELAYQNEQVALYKVQQ